MTETLFELDFMSFAFNHRSHLVNLKEKILLIE